eukprot:2586994-Rhodomonas_salina.3
MIGPVSTQLCSNPNRNAQNPLEHSAPVGQSEHVTSFAAESTLAAERYLFGAHSQAAGLCSPARRVPLPVGQEVHALRPRSAPKVSIGHGVQAAGPTPGLYEPAPHGTQFWATISLLEAVAKLFGASIVYPVGQLVSWYTSTFATHSDPETRGVTALTPVQISGVEDVRAWRAGQADLRVVRERTCGCAIVRLNERVAIWAVGERVGLIDRILDPSANDRDLNPLSIVAIARTPAESTCRITTHRPDGTVHARLLSCRLQGGSICLGGAYASRKLCLRRPDRQGTRRTLQARVERRGADILEVSSHRTFLTWLGTDAVFVPPRRACRAFDADLGHTFLTPTALLAVLSHSFEDIASIHQRMAGPTAGQPIDLSVWNPRRVWHARLDHPRSIADQSDGAWLALMVVWIDDVLSGALAGKALLQRLLECAMRRPIRGIHELKSVWAALQIPDSSICW